MKVLAACVLLALLSGCAPARVVEQPSTVWPFQSLRIDAGRKGAVIAFYSRAESAPTHLVVVVQDPPCHAADATTPRLSTSGVLWKQLHADSAFVQFESVGVRKGAASVPPECSGATLGNVRADKWTADLARSVAAIRRYAALQNVPTIYFGIGAGAVPAARLAARDAATRLLVLLNAGRTDAKGLAGSAPVVIVQSSLDNQWTGANALFAALAAQSRPIYMLRLHELGHDLGLSGDRPECFDASMQQIVSRVRLMIGDARLRTGQMEDSDCDRALAEFPDSSADHS